MCHTKGLVQQRGRGNSNSLELKTKIMKKYIYFILLFCVALTCKAQSPVYNIMDVREGIKGSYYKDLNNELDGYDGTYTYYSSHYDDKIGCYVSEEFIIVLKKKVLSYDGYYYEDLIVGEYEFKRNGGSLDNTLANIDINYTNEEINHAITGNFILTGTELGCPDCLSTEKRLRLTLVNKVRRNIKGLDIRKTTVNGAPALKVSIFPQEHYFEEDDDYLMQPGTSMPATGSTILGIGDYIMKKHPW